MDKLVICKCIIIFYRHDNPLPRFEGVLSPNTILQEAVKILEGKISAPESITQDRNGKLLLHKI